jgi:hypothetical protein
VSDEGDIARAFEQRDMFAELREVRDILARLEKLMVRIALSLGIKPEA